MQRRYRRRVPRCPPVTCPSTWYKQSNARVSGVRNGMRPSRGVRPTNSNRPWLDRRGRARRFGRHRGPHTRLYPILSPPAPFTNVKSATPTPPLGICRRCDSTAQPPRVKYVAKPVLLTGRDGNSGRKDVRVMKNFLVCWPAPPQSSISHSSRSAACAPSVRARGAG
ncbi:hypothetical protein VUR80DRAFT_5049 [Thermomyces stellatus]